MDSGSQWIVQFAEAAEIDEQAVGGKAAKLAQLAAAGFQVPPGFFITTAAYEYFVREAALARIIRIELGRKPFESMRWEEIWDAALRIRSRFVNAALPPPLAQAIASAVGQLGKEKALAVRSSAPGEDSSRRSFAGLHESVVGVSGEEAVLDSVRIVWASLWSDAALLYRQELSLDPSLSRMAVVVQELVDEDRSGVAFGRDPRWPELDRAIIEAVPGPCGDLVDGLVDPDRWILQRSSGQILEWSPGAREDTHGDLPLLEDSDLTNLHGMLLEVERLFDWAPDTEWTGLGEQFTLLQARPITSTVTSNSDPRGWYLSLRPTMKRLAALSKRVSEDLIPELEALGRRYAGEPLESYSDQQLSSAIAERRAALEEWRQVYLDDFIPFAHGVRQLGTYYNDIVQPDDPYEFVNLLKGQQMVASRRNQTLHSLARQLHQSPALHKALQEVVAQPHLDWRTALTSLRPVSGGKRLCDELEALLSDVMDVTYGGERLAERPLLLLNTILELAQASSILASTETRSRPTSLGSSAMEQRLLDAVGPARHEEAKQVLEIARLSWRLRDDDNLLVGRLESQLLRALNVAARRLTAAGRLDSSDRVGLEATAAVLEALCNPQGGPVTLPNEPEPEQESIRTPDGESPRQLIGQPASPGLASGRVRLVASTEDLGRFREGEVLVCDAIQPTMTHLVPLACAIVERRGGMLIHGAIIARELGIPCVNGVPNAGQWLQNGDIVTVDGYLGIVTVGSPEFTLETGGSS